MGNITKNSTTTTQIKLNRNKTTILSFVIELPITRISKKVIKKVIATFHKTNCKIFIVKDISPPPGKNMFPPLKGIINNITGELVQSFNK